MSKKFIKPENDPDQNPVEYFNDFKAWSDVFDGVKNITWVTSHTISNSKGKDVTFKIKDDELEVVGKNILGLDIGNVYSKFKAFSRIRFKGNQQAAQIYIARTWLGYQIPYVRVGTDYFKIITKPDRYGVDRKIIKGWKKEEIKQDHPDLIKHITQFDDFCIVPDNTNHQIIVNGCYNLYAPFGHTPHASNVTHKDIPQSMMLMKHIFGNQLDLGLIYLKALYQHPTKTLPILCLVSRLRQTGKTTFLNWMQMIFGDNFIQINPEDLSSQFNSVYASKNVIALDETVIEKSHAVEKLKSIATAKTLSVNQKFVANYALPFYGKVILCTNKEKDFMKIDEDEIRFWVRKVNSIAEINTSIEDQLKNEIPKFLKFLTDLPSIDFSQSRMVFTPDQIKNSELTIIQEESFSWLRKELVIQFENFFHKNAQISEFEITPTDIKEKWFANNNQVSAGYLLKVLRDEMQLIQSKVKRYSPFNENIITGVLGRTFTITRSNYTQITVEDQESVELPF